MKERRNTRRYGPVLVVAIVALLASVGPVAAAPANPFVGAWETNDDGIPARMEFGANGHFHLRAAPTSVCGEAIPATLLGSFEPYDGGNGIPTVKVTADVYCHYGSAGGRQWFNQVEYFIWYLEDTGTLMSTVCWFRPGSDPSACDPGAPELWEHLNFQFGPGRLIRNPDSLNEHLKFRQAIAHAIDKDRIAAEIAAADRPIDSYVEAFLPALSQGAWAQYDYNPAASMQLLDELCAELGRDCSSNPPRAVFTTTSNSAARVQLAGLLDEMLSDVGILFESQLEDSLIFYGSTLDDGTFDLGLWAWTSRTPELAGLVAIHDVFDPDSPPPDGLNVYRWGTPDSSVIDANTARFAELRDLMNSTSDEAQIIDYIHEAENILADQVVMIPLYIRVPETP